MRIIHLYWFLQALNTSSSQGNLYRRQSLNHAAKSVSNVLASVGASTEAVSMVYMQELTHAYSAAVTVEIV